METNPQARAYLIDIQSKAFQHFGGYDKVKQQQSGWN